MTKQIFTVTYLQDFTCEELLLFIKDIPDECITFDWSSDFHSQFSWGQEKCTPQIRKGLTNIQGEVRFKQYGAIVTYYKCTITVPVIEGE